MRLTASAAIAAAMVAAAGCTNIWFDTARDAPQNEGANADAGQTLHIRNAFLLSGSDPASPAPQQALYAVLINQSHRPARLERITLDGGATVRLPGPITLPPAQPVGVGTRPLGTVTGARGDTVPMTFTFSGAAPVRVHVPIKSRTGHYANLTPAPGGSPATAPPGTAPATPSPGTATPSPS